MAPTSIDIAVQGRAGMIALDRPDRLNAINRNMMSEIGEALAAFAADDAVAAVVIHGRGRAFSAGMDLKDDAAAGTAGTEAWRRVLAENLDFVMGFWDFPKPTIAAVHGPCMAAAVDMALACDITVAEEGAFFGKPELQFGSTITAMVMPFLTGPKLAKEFLLTGEDRISAERAHGIGMVNRVVAPGQAVATALEIATRVGRLDDDAVRLTKRSINAALDGMGLRAALAKNLELAVRIETTETPSRRQFAEIVRRDGLKAALAWREGRFSD